MSLRSPASLSRAARIVSSRAASTWVAMSASLNWIAWCWAICLPNVLRSWLYLSASSRARWAIPTPRAATLTRPSSSASIIWTKPWPRPSVLAAEDAVRGSPVAVEDELGRLDALVAHLLDLGRDVEALVRAGVLTDAGLLLADEAGHALVPGLGVGVGAHEREDERAEQAVGDPHLLAVDLVGAVVASCARSS